MWKLFDRIFGWFPIVVLWTKDYAELLHQMTDLENKLGREEDYYQKLDAEHTDAQGKILDLEADRDQLKAQIKELETEAGADNLKIYHLEHDLHEAKFQREKLVGVLEGVVSKIRASLKEVNDASPVTEAGRENPNRGIDHDHPGRDQGGQGPDRDRGAEVGVGDQAGGQA